MCTSFYSELYQDSKGDVALRDKIDEIEVYVSHGEFGQAGETLMKLVLQAPFHQ